MLIQTDPLRELTAQIFAAAGCDRSEADCIARHLVDSNLCGFDSHGVIRIMQYVDNLRQGTVRPGQQMQVVRETETAAVVDGNLGFGQVICEQAMELAAGKAKQAGMALVTIRNCGHVGRLGDWAEQLARADLISLHFLNTTGLGMMAVPFGGSDRRLSLNAMAFCVPVAGRQPLLLDCTTTVTAEGKIRVARNQGVPVPPGTIVDEQGRPTTDPNDFYDGGAVLPFGGHKGYGLNIIADVLTGALSGGGCTAPDAEYLINNSTCIAIDPDPLTDREAYFGEITRYCDWVTDSPPSEPGREVIMPGTFEHRTRAERQSAGILIDDTTWGQIVELAVSLGVETRIE